MNYTLLTRIKLLFALAIILFTFQANAASNGCNNLYTNFDKAQCKMNAIAVADKMINDSYRELRLKIKTFSIKTQFDKMQSNWITHREKQCYSNMRNVNVECSFSLTQNRKDFLVKRLNECRKSQCNEALIATKTW